ncbi:hypothetical protein Peur_026119 [Populus x canadensis]
MDQWRKFGVERSASNCAMRLLVGFVLVGPPDDNFVSVFCRISVCVFVGFTCIYAWFMDFDSCSHNFSLLLCPALSIYKRWVEKRCEAKSFAVIYSGTRAVMAPLNVNCGTVLKEGLGKSQQPYIDIESIQEGCCYMVLFIANDKDIQSGVDHFKESAVIQVIVQKLFVNSELSSSIYKLLNCSGTSNEDGSAKETSWIDCRFDSLNGRTCLHCPAYHGHFDYLQATLSAAQSNLLLFLGNYIIILKIDFAFSSLLFFYQSYLCIDNELRVSHASPAGYSE